MLSENLAIRSHDVLILFCRSTLYQQKYEMQAQYTFLEINFDLVRRNQQLFTTLDLEKVKFYMPVFVLFVDLVH